MQELSSQLDAGETRGRILELVLASVPAGEWQEKAIWATESRYCCQAEPESFWVPNSATNSATLPSAYLSRTCRTGTSKDRRSYFSEKLHLHSEDSPQSAAPRLIVTRMHWPVACVILHRTEAQCFQSMLSDQLECT